MIVWEKGHTYQNFFKYNSNAGPAGMILYLTSYSRDLIAVEPALQKGQVTRFSRE